MSVWLDSSSNSNKFKQSYFRDFVDVSGDILIRNGLSLKLYNNTIPTRVQFSVNSSDFHIYNNSDQTYYDISNTQLIYLQDLSENVQERLNVFTDKTKHIATNVTNNETMIELIPSQNLVKVHTGLDVSSTIFGRSDLSINQNMSVGGNTLINGRMDICGNLYAQYPSNTIPKSAINGPIGLPITFGTIIGTDISSTKFADISAVYFDTDAGFDVTELNTGEIKVSMNSTFKYWDLSGQVPTDASNASITGLVAQGLDTMNFVAGNNIQMNLYTTGTGNDKTNYFKISASVPN